MYTDDAYAILLLCASLGKASKYAPLSLAEYNRVANALHTAGKRPSALLTAESIPAIPGMDSVRLQWLLGRRINLGFCLEDWQRKGIWTLARSDRNYPEKIRTCMQSRHAPPLLFGTGNQKNLKKGGLAIIGPDNVPAGQLKKTDELVHTAVKEGETVIAAGDRKIAKQVVHAVHQHAGHIIWVLHDGALRPRLERIHREAIASGRMLMISAQSPEAPKESGEQVTVGALSAALADKLIYVDGTCSKDKMKRTDRFGTMDAALKYSSICRLIRGRQITPEGNELLAQRVQHCSGSFCQL